MLVIERSKKHGRNQVVIIFEDRQKLVVTLTRDELTGKIKLHFEGPRQIKVVRKEIFDLNPEAWMQIPPGRYTEAEIAEFMGRLNAHEDVSGEVPGA